MKDIKHLIAALLVCSMLLCALACGSSANISGADDPTPAEESQLPESEPESQEPESKMTRFEELEAKYKKLTDGLTALNKYESAVTKYENETKEKGKIIFYGSSTFTRWSKEWNTTDLEDLLVSSTGEKKCINHGTGGCNIAQMVYYYERMIKAYEPQAVVIKGDSNYNNADFKFTLGQVWDMNEYLAELIHRDFPDITIYFSVNEEMLYPNKLILMNKLKEYEASHDYIKYVKVDMFPLYTADPTGHAGSTDYQTDVYMPDNVHMTPLGYSYFTQIWKDALKDELG